MDPGVPGPWVQGPLGNPATMRWLTLAKPASKGFPQITKGAGRRAARPLCGRRPKAASFMEAVFAKVSHRMLLGFPKDPGTQGPGTQGSYIHICIYIHSYRRLFSLASLCFFVKYLQTTQKYMSKISRNVTFAKRKPAGKLHNIAQGLQSWQFPNYWFYWLLFGTNR
jgi:hypothetical protein